jgi:hypothetical protein
MVQKPEQVSDVFRVADAMAWGTLEEIRKVIYEVDSTRKVELIDLPSVLRKMLETQR